MYIYESHSCGTDVYLFHTYENAVKFMLDNQPTYDLLKYCEAQTVKEIYDEFMNEPEEDTKHAFSYYNMVMGFCNADIYEIDFSD